MLDKMSWGSRLGHALMVLRALMLGCLAAGLLAAGALAQSTPAPPSSKVDQLIELLNDPAVKAWLDQQATQSSPTAPSSPAAMPMTMGNAPVALSNSLSMIRGHLTKLIEEIPLLPAQFARAWYILLAEFEGAKLIGIFALLAVFVAAGFGFDRLARRLAAPYRRWMGSLPSDTPQGRAKSFFARMLYALITISAFVIGSAGVFVIFDWPPLLREILLAYLAATIFVRIVMMTTRAVLLPPQLGHPKGKDLRALPMSDELASHWYIWLGICAGWFAFMNATLSLMSTFGFSEAGIEVIAIAASFILLVLVLIAVWRRPRLSSIAPDSPQRGGSDAFSWIFSFYAVLVWLTLTSGAWPIFWGLFAAGVLPFAIRLTGRATRYLLRPPEDGSGGQTLEPIYVSIIDRGIRMVLIVAATYLLARAWGFQVSSMSQTDSLETRILRGFLNVLVIVIAADFGWTLIKGVVTRKLTESKPGSDEGAQQHQARLRTLLPIIQNILLATLISIAALMVLSALGIEIGPLIAGAGVVGVAIGFGAQTLVKDVISGIFYLFDDAFRVGEYIESGTYKGTVENFSLRSVKLRHHRGYLFTVPFGLLGAVQNMSRDWVIDKFNITVGYDTDIDKARKIIKKIGLALASDPEYAPYVIEPLKMQGVQEFGDYGIQIRIKMKMRPGEQFGMKRKAYILIKKEFEENGISIPVPTVQVKGEETAGAAASSVLLKKPAEPGAPA